MNETINKEEFAENVRKYVKKALPEELAEAQVRTTCLDLWADSPHMVLLFIRRFLPGQMVSGVLRQKRNSRDHCRCYY